MSKASIFMNAGWIGLAGLATMALSLFEGIPEAVSITGILITMAACWVMLFTRNADEYTRGLWTSAASLAFATLLILFIALPFFEGMYEGFQDDLDGTEHKRDIPSEASIICAIIAFYIGLFWKRLRGAI